MTLSEAVVLVLARVGRTGGVGSGAGAGDCFWMDDVRRTGTGAAGVVAAVVGVERDGVVVTGVARLGAVVVGVGWVAVAGGDVVRVAGAGVVLVVVGAGVVVVVAGAGVVLVVAGAGVVVVAAGVELVGVSTPPDIDPKFFSAAALFSALILSISSPAAALAPPPRLPVRP